MESKRTWLAVLAVMGFVALSCVVMSNRMGPSAALSAFEVEEAGVRSFMVKPGKSYTAEEFPRRFQAYRDNMAYARMMNAQNPKLTLGATKFADLTHEEFSAKYLGGYKPKATRNVVHLPTDSLPASVDWVTAGAVTPVKNQGQCGSCWSFSTTGSIEGAHYLATKNLVSLSEQQLVDCSTGSPYDNEGCDGGSMDAAFQYVIATGGLETEAEYPYTAEDGTCVVKTNSLAVSIKSYQDVQENSESALMAAVAQQPVSVAVDANTLWQLYFGGIIEFLCGTSLDHGVLAVGYGTSTDGTLYWLVKNSWGADWGEDGYIRLKRNPTSTNGGMCGIAMDPSYPIA